jgi:hypothetical protein
MLQWTLVKEYWHVRKDGKREHYVRVRCGCGTERSMSMSIWASPRRPLACKKCNRNAQLRRGYIESDIPDSMLACDLVSVTAQPTR